VGYFFEKPIRHFSRRLDGNMKKAITISLSVLLAGYALAIFLPINPDEARPGTRLSGEAAEGEIDWSSVGNSKLVIVQTST
jgi:hypothetical protein